MRIILIASMLLGLTAHAGFSTKDQLAAYFSKNDRCLLAISFFHKDMDKFLASMGSVFIKGANYSNDILCVTDLALGQGTVHETQGCGVANFSADDDEVKQLKSPWFPWDLPMLAGKSCASGGFKELMDTKFNNGFGRKMPVRKIIGQPYGDGRAEVVYFSKPEYLDIYEGREPKGVADKIKGFFGGSGETQKK